MHLPDQQAVTFREDDSLAAVASRAAPTTTLMAWFKANQDYPDATAVLYQDFPSRYVWDKGARMWMRRQRGQR